MRASIALLLLLCFNGCVIMNKNQYRRQIDMARTLGYLEGRSKLSVDTFKTKVSASIKEICEDTGWDK